MYSKSRSLRILGMTVRFAYTEQDNLAENSYRRVSVALRCWVESKGDKGSARVLSRAWWSLGRFARRLHQDCDV